jgi:E3 ubiquitin-protein ligase RAD18
VQCPICQKDVKTEAINAHIDRNCVDEPTSKFSKISIQPSSSSATSQKPVKQPDRLAALNYGMVKDNALRKKLTDLGISAAGSRQLMERRYTEWVTLWNANCDATKPKTKGELKRDLEVWEKTQGGRASASNMGAQIRDKDFDGVAWSSKHDDSFRQLIANARRKPAVKASLPESKSDQLDGAASHSAGTGVASSNQVGVHTEMGDDGFGDGAEQLAEEFAESGGQDPSPRKGRRFFDENIDPQSSAAPPSSQYSSSMPIQGKDAGISSNIATIRPVQP